jgi:hypothetical protein
MKSNINFPYVFRTVSSLHVSKPKYCIHFSSLLS